VQLKHKVGTKVRVYNLLDLFSGIGGFSLGLERSGGFKTVAFCEIEPYPCKVLKHHWPEVPIYGDIRELTADRLAADGITVDAICGGFPCQDISHAGKGAGIEGERSGLWFEYARLIGELRPRYVFVENVSALLNRGIDRVLGDLAALGYDAEWHCIPASAVGAPHRRDRIWIVAYPRHGSGGSIGAFEEGRERQAQRTANPSEAGRSSDQSKDVENTQRRGREGLLHGDARSDHAGSSSHVADTDGSKCETRHSKSIGSKKGSEGNSGTSRNGSCLSDTDSSQRERGSLSSRIYEEHALARSNGWWEVEPNVGRVAHGVPAWSHRLKALGNAVVPQIPELLGRAVLEWEDDQ